MTDEERDETAENSDESAGTEEEAVEAGTDASQEVAPTEDADPPAEAEAEESEAPAEEPAAEEPTAPEGDAGDSDAADDADDAPQAPEAPAADAPAAEKPKAKDLPPGAELEPIAIEDDRELSAEERAALEAEAEERAAREAAEDSDDDDAPVRSGPSVKLKTSDRIQATGKRKSAIARILVKGGSGQVTVNKKPVEDYFPRDNHRAMAVHPLVITGYDKSVDVSVRVEGGGVSGQAGAVRHGIARAMVDIDPELRGELKRRGMLTRDDRKKERRKAGLKKARKKPQFSKR